MKSDPPKKPSDNPSIATRQQLYAAVWQSPLADIAKRLGIKSRALAAICQRLNVPYPKRGYWQKRHAGRIVRSPPALPDATSTDIELAIPERSLRRIGPVAQMNLVVPEIASELDADQAAIAATDLEPSAAMHRAWRTVSALAITPEVERSLATKPFRLSPREIDVVRYVYEENSTPQIASRLAISPRTVEVHRAKILDKVRARSTVGLVKLLMTMIVSGGSE